MARFSLYFIPVYGIINTWKRAIFNAGGIKNGNYHKARKYIPNPYIMRVHCGREAGRKSHDLQATGGHE